MSASKHFDKIALVVTACILVLTILFMNGGSLGLELMAHTMGYENRLFDNTRVHTIDIVMDDWEEFIAQATSEEYYAAAVVIDGEAYKNVGIRGKGNTSLSTVSSMNSERYSFKVEFDHYDNSISYHGLDKLSLNNLIQDTTMMKDYLSYTMMKEFGAAAPLCSFVYITVNGEDWGLYLAVEGVEDSFLERNYGSDYGELYKPDSMSFGGMGGFGMGSSDVKLQYVDDNINSYSNIWNNAKTDITEADQTRLIESLRKLSLGEQLEDVVDMEQVIRYFVVHNYVCNGDSYTGAMIHNYYLYEENGQLTMIPWDYNLAFGTFQSGNGQSTVNTPIDAPVSGGTGEDRPMWNWILSDESYTELYHRYFAEFLNTVDVQAIIDNAYNLIRSYVEKDPTAFYPYEEFTAGVETMRRFCALRSESISMQLTNGETTSEMNYVDASDLTLSDMGSMGGKGGFGGGMPNEFEDRTPTGDSTVPTLDAGTNASPKPGVQGNTDTDVVVVPQGSGAPQGFDPSQMPGDFGAVFPGQASDGTETAASGNTDFARPSGGNFNPNMGEGEYAASSSDGLMWLAVSLLILGAGLLIAKRYQR